MEKITKKQAQEWANALRSGRYQQGHNYLQGLFGYCCMGVACLLFIPKGKLELDADGFIIGQFPGHQKHAPEWLKKINNDFRKKTGWSLSILNDLGPGVLWRFNFNEIADLIELVYVHGALD